jgi:hypothetical protein
MSESTLFSQSVRDYCMKLATGPLPIFPLRPAILRYGKREHRVATATFWRTFHHDGKTSPGWWGWGCTLGGFNVSNLMGITRRKIDIGKKITFYFLQNVWKCAVFFAFAFKVCKKCYYDPKKNFLKNIIMGIKKTQNFMLISNSLMPT